MFSFSSFKRRSGLSCVTRAITGGISDPREKCDHHRVDISENPIELHQVKPLRPEPRIKKRMSVCSMIGIFFICVAIIGLIAIGIAMYIECTFFLLFIRVAENVSENFSFIYACAVVTKPSWAAQSKQTILNETTICDFLLNICDNNTASTATELNSEKNTTGNNKLDFTN